jgi:hypothetical protein
MIAARSCSSTIQRISASSRDAITAWLAPRPTAMDAASRAEDRILISSARDNRLLKL